MLIKCTDPNIRYTGRFGLFESTERPIMAATACGSYFDLIFQGRDTVLHFDVEDSFFPRGHMYISIDNSPRIEVAIDPYIRISAQDDGPHRLNVIYKSAIESQHRWHLPLSGKLAFVGIETDFPLLPVEPDNRPTIEFIGDSITEGIWVDTDCKYTQFTYYQNNFPWQNDSTATYAWLTAEKLNFRPYIMGYGSLGTTKRGNGGVPRVIESYPLNFQFSATTFPSCDYIVINHGANDYRNKERYADAYYEFLKLVRTRNPESKIIVLTPFFGKFEDELPEVVNRFNKEEKDNVYLISTRGWIPYEPIHPLREGHKHIAELLYEAMQPIIKD